MGFTELYTHSLHTFLESFRKGQAARRLVEACPELASALGGVCDSTRGFGGRAPVEIRLLFGCDEERHADNDDEENVCEDCEDLLERIETAEGANQALANLLAENQEWAEDLRRDNDRFAQQCREIAKERDELKARCNAIQDTRRSWEQTANERAARIAEILADKANLEELNDRLAHSNHSLADELTTTRKRLRHVEELRDADGAEIERLRRWLGEINRAWGFSKSSVDEPNKIEDVLYQYAAHIDAQG